MTTEPQETQAEPAEALRQALAVDRVATRVLAVPSVPRIASFDRVFPHVYIVLLRIDGADGERGYSSLWTLDGGDIRLLIESLRLLAAPLRAASSRTIPEFYDLMLQRINFLGVKGVTVFGMSGFDMAFYDMLCARDGRSLAELLGKGRQTVPTYWSGLYVGSPAQELVAELEAQWARGFRAFKMRVGQPDADRDLERVRLMRSTLSSDAIIAVDAVQAWETEQALVMARALADDGLAWLEDPIVHHDYVGLRKVIAESPVPIATGENEYLPEGFETILQARPRYVLADPQRAGGITGWLRVAAAAHEAGIELSPHVYPHLAIQLLAATDGASILEYVPWWDPILDYELTLRDGNIAIPDGVGTGLKLDFEAVERFAVSNWESLTD